MTDPKLVELEALAAAATPGPWVHYEQPVKTPEDAKRWLCDAVDESVKAGAFVPAMHGVGAGDMAKDLGWLIAAQTGCGPTSEANAALIARVHEALAMARKYHDALETIAAQSSGVVGSTARADCMAAYARAALSTKEPTNE